MSNSSRTLSAEPLRRRNLYGRRQTRPLGAERSAIMDAHFPALSIPDADLREDASLDPRGLFKKQYEETWLEIGFGSGERLAALMERYPEQAYLGAEPFVNGMASFVKSVKDKPCDNVRVLMDDALILCRSLAGDSLDGIYILNPDPWPKKRHHKRRIVRRDNLDEFARILKPGGTLVLSSDVPDLAGWMVREAFTHGAFEWQARQAADWRNPPENWIKTRYEEKGAKGAEKMAYLLFRKKT